MTINSKAATPLQAGTLGATASNKTWVNYTVLGLLFQAYISALPRKSSRSYLATTQKYSFFGRMQI